MAIVSPIFSTFYDSVNKTNNKAKRKRKRKRKAKTRQNAQTEIVKEAIFNIFRYTMGIAKVSINGIDERCRCHSDCN